MKQRRAQTMPIHLEYLHSLALALPCRRLARTKCRELLLLSRRNLYKLRKIKKTICKGCKDVLIPKVTCSSEFIRRANGFGLLISCFHCQTEQFTVLRGV